MQLSKNITKWFSQKKVSFSAHFAINLFCLHNLKTETNYGATTHRACEWKNKTNFTSYSNWPRVLFDLAHKQCSGIAIGRFNCLTSKSKRRFLANDILLPWYYPHPYVRYHLMFTFPPPSPYLVICVSPLCEWEQQVDISSSGCWVKKMHALIVLLTLQLWQTYFYLMQGTVRNAIIGAAREVCYWLLLGFWLLLCSRALIMGSCNLCLVPIIKFLFITWILGKDDKRVVSLTQNLWKA